MHTPYDTQASLSTGRNWLCSLAILVIPLTGCGTPEPETGSPPDTAETQRSANFVSAQPPAQVTSPQWQRPARPVPYFEQFSRFRYDPSIPNSNPWAQPGNLPPSAATPGYPQPYSNAPLGQGYAGTQQPVYRYRPLKEKEIQEIQQQRNWAAEHQYPSTQSYNPYAAPQSAQPPTAINPWDSRYPGGQYGSSRRR